MYYNLYIKKERFRMNAKFNEIIKYNPARMYFGNWTPRQIHEIYQNMKGSDFNRTEPLTTGIITEDDICDTLWNEMSYNPTRFGTVSPFVFNGKNSIKQFCKKYSSCNSEDKTMLFLQKIAFALNDFMFYMDAYDQTFSKTGRTQNPVMNIGLQQDALASNTEYKVLSKLVACIHLICSQNGLDYTRSKKHHIAMNQIIIQRHPNLVRPQKIPNYSKLNSMQAQSQEIQSRITHQESVILETQMRINVLEEFDSPADTSREHNALESQQAELERLESEYQDIQNRMKIMTCAPHIHQ